MPEKKFSASRVHDLFGSVLGLFALVMLVSSPWQVDSSGPDPFYKGPLIFPLIVFSLILAGALPSMWRLVRPSIQASWYLDGHGRSFKTLIILGLLILYPAGLLFLGLEISTWLFLFIALKLVKQDSLLKLTIIPILVTIILFVLFKFFLDVWFPEPLLIEPVKEWAMELLRK
ncbi:MAG: tripartite tricarboxylate transporter TctB family protein [Deltaproteobacteria bacterium]|uniref:tripartite tricarboxylate transporter TctB family protein n=1 Tax=Desulfobacula sp. TaxID=2593537 RepID=UPI0019A13BB1|nr:tripartite tricarboxylate transporter TctB family protein [Candidatus Desulfobacula maris]MBL6994328.1 tripartite tricarboxylate transporter TctB family protein [Desulfobacula sp.]